MESLEVGMTGLAEQQVTCRSLGERGQTSGGRTFTGSASPADDLSYSLPVERPDDNRPQVDSKCSRGRSNAASLAGPTPGHPVRSCPKASIALCSKPMVDEPPRRKSGPSTCRSALCGGCVQAPTTKPRSLSMTGGLRIAEPRWRASINRACGALVLQWPLRNEAPRCREGCRSSLRHSGRARPKFSSMTANAAHGAGGKLVGSSNDTTAASTPETLVSKRRVVPRDRVTFVRLPTEPPVRQRSP
jgi:hypothetical protein